MEKSEKPIVVEETAASKVFARVKANNFERKKFSNTSSVIPFQLKNSAGEIPGGGERETYLSCFPSLLTSIISRKIHKIQNLISVNPHPRKIL